MSLRNILLWLINSHQLNNFLISDIKELCRGHVSSKTEEHFNRKVYKGIWSLTKQGILTMQRHSPDRQLNTYSLTAAGIAACSSILKEAHSYTPTLDSSTDIAVNLELLKNKLSEYSAALAAASAEAQEYQELARELPELFTTLEAKFLVAKERAVMFQGRLAAIENVLKDLS